MKNVLRINPIILLALVGLAATGPAQANGSIEDGKTKAIACQVCHGKGGKSGNPLYPVLSGQHSQYIVKQLKAFQAGTRKDPIMNGMAAPLSEQDMEDVAAYFHSTRSEQNGSLDSGVPLENKPQ